MIATALASKRRGLPKERSDRTDEHAGQTLAPRRSLARVHAERWVSATHADLAQNVRRLAAEEWCLELFAATHYIHSMSAISNQREIVDRGVLNARLADFIDRATGRRHRSGPIFSPC
jgi:hypothetical protein